MENILGGFDRSFKQVFISKLVGFFYSSKGHFVTDFSSQALFKYPLLLPAPLCWCDGGSPYGTAAQTRRKHCPWPSNGYASLWKRISNCLWRACSNVGPRPACRFFGFTLSQIPVGPGEPHTSHGQLVKTTHMPTQTQHKACKKIPLTLWSKTMC